MESVSAVESPRTDLCACNSFLSSDFEHKTVVILYFQTDDEERFVSPCETEELLLNASVAVADECPSVSCLVLRDNFLIDGESRNICWEFLADLLADMLPGIAAEAKGYPVVSLEQMDLNNRYPPAGSLFNSVRS